MTDSTALLFGGTGQLGTELLSTAPKEWRVVSASADVDVASLAAVRETVAMVKPSVVLNAAAFTAVDGAEKERELAFAVNETGAASVAKAASETGARVIHISTDFVFDGTKSQPYTPADPTGPLGVYGESKLAGELAVLRTLSGSATVIRTSWLYSTHGKNFVKTILGLLTTREEIRVVSDQRGSPTYARGLAKVMWRAAENPGVTGLYHWADEGSVTWYDFAVAIRDEGLARGLLRKNTPVHPIITAEYPTNAVRPPYSVLDSSLLASRLGISPTNWRVNLGFMLDELAAPAPV